MVVAHNVIKLFAANRFVFVYVGSDRISFYVFGIGKSFGIVQSQQVRGLLRNIL
jgi:hypothetical protein